MKAFKMFVDFDREEAWLNRKAGEGWLIVKAGLVYTFAPIEPGSAVVRVDYRPTMGTADFDDYRNLFWDAGWQHVAGSRGSGAQYFASFSGDTNADIFSDATSKAQRYRKAMAMTSVLLLPFFIITVALWTQGNLAVELYLTPGLWELQGWQFVRAFAFETPFALLRLAGPLVLVGACVVLAALIVYQWLLYRRALALTRV
jgi:hypothetical protein